MSFRTMSVLLLMAATIYAYEEKCMPDLVVPTDIPPKNLEATIVHRLDRNPAGQFPDNFMTSANARLGVRYVVWSKIEAGADYLYCSSSLISPKEFSLHTAYSYFIPKLFLRTQVDLLFFGAQQPGFETPWDYNMLYQLNVQSEPFWKRVLPVINLAYDGLLKKFGMGGGIDVAVAENIDIVGEYYPAIGARDTTPEGNQNVNCYSVGVKITTYGHHFLFTLGNSTDIGVRHLMHGAKNNNIYFGFNLQRLFAF
jgi:hypothetical protein